MDKITIFTTSIYAKRIEGLDLQKINQEIYRLQEEIDGVKMSNMGGWHSKGFDYPKYHNHIFNEVIEKIKPYIILAFDDYGVRSGTTDIHYWLNVNRKFNYNRTHNHGTTKLSAVLYTKVPKDSGRLILERSDSTTHPKINYNVDNWAEYFIQPEDGLLFIFPGHLNHFVEQNLTNDEDDRRVSIAFNFT